ncbi:hypothetical protein [Amycolatopsis magusensis]|uniref:hypothetical protein n=1 Tax=Amycolatopsis magusensis TaxID=882444 RepID=UPI003C2D5D7A
MTLADMEASHSELRTGVVARPSSVTAAAVLWIVLGVWLTVTGFGALPIRQIPFGVALVVLVAGLAVWWLGAALKRGADVRTAAAVLGLVTAVMVLPVVFALPAIILQYRPASRRWFELPPAQR